MAITKGKSLVYSNSVIDSLSPNNKSSKRSLSTCRLANHRISAHRVTISDYDTHHDKIGNADQYIFIVRCHRCNLEWMEVWRTSKWFIHNNNKNEISY
jgi:hypothetical protein